MKRIKAIEAFGMVLQNIQNIQKKILGLRHKQ